MPQWPAVEPDVPDGVQAEEHQSHPLVLGDLGRAGERGAEPPVALLDPADVALVAVLVRVLNPARGQQRLVHAAGYHGGQPAVGRQRGHVEPDVGADQFEIVDLQDFLLVFYVRVIGAAWPGVFSRPISGTRRMATAPSRTSTGKVRNSAPYTPRA